MLIGYARVSKADGSQLLDLQRDALAPAGAKPPRTEPGKGPSDGDGAWAHVGMHNTHGRQYESYTQMDPPHVAKGLCQSQIIDTTLSTHVP